jgi:hypothetical protein
MRTKHYLFVPVIALLVFSCKKDTDAGANTLNPVSTAEDKIKDSALLYSRDIYLWYSQIPADFKPRNYADPGKIMEAIRPYSKETGFTDPVDRWSFAIKKQEWDNVSAGVAKDFGLNVFFKEEGDLRVRMVERASPTGKAGIRRGWRITKINGSTNIATSNAESIVNAIYYSENVTLTLLKPDGNTTDVALSAATYQEHPVALDSIYTMGGKKTGYMVYNSFLGDSLETMNEFQRVFNRFSTANVDDVIIDLRYNGGGYVLYQRELANYLVNNSGNGNLMMKTEYNDKYSRYNSSVNFNKKGTLNLPRIFFIVSKSSASASELLINNLKPYMNVFLVGPTRTYGKPVGYFNIGVGDWYIFPVSSRTTNKNGQGNYYNGFELNSTVADGLDKDWGDTNESCLASALKYIVSGSFRMKTADEYKVNPVIVSTNSRLEPTSFKGLVEKQKF